MLCISSPVLIKSKLCNFLQTLTTCSAVCMHAVPSKSSRWRTRSGSVVSMKVSRVLFLPPGHQIHGIFWYNLILVSNWLYGHSSRACLIWSHLPNRSREIYPFLIAAGENIFCLGWCDRVWGGGDVPHIHTVYVYIAICIYIYIYCVCQISHNPWAVLCYSAHNHFTHGTGWLSDIWLSVTAWSAKTTSVCMQWAPGKS